MKYSLKLLTALVCILAILPTGPAIAGPHGAQAVVCDSVTVSGAWVSIQWYESDGSYSGVGDPEVSDWQERAQGNTPVDLGTSAGDAYGSASSTIIADAPGLMPLIDIHSNAEVHDLPVLTSHWSSAFSQGGANWLTSGATQTVTVRIDYRYDLDLTEAHPGEPYAFAKLYLAFWGPLGELLLTPDEEFAAEGNYLVKTVQIGMPGTGTGLVTGWKSWEVEVVSGAFYSFWSMAWGEVWTQFDPTAAKEKSWGAIKDLLK